MVLICISLLTNEVGCLHVLVDHFYIFCEVSNIVPAFWVAYLIVF